MDHTKYLLQLQGRTAKNQKQKKNKNIHNYINISNTHLNTMCLRRNSQEENHKKLENTFIQMKIKTKHKNV